MTEEIKDKKLRAELENDTLYIPQSVLVSFNPFNIHEQKKDESVASAYPYPYRIVSNPEMYQIFDVEKRGRYLFEYVRMNAEKFITIYDVKDKKIIYRNRIIASYNIKAKDFKKIR